MAWPCWVSRSGGCIPPCVPGGSRSAEHQLGKGWLVEPWGVETWREPHLWTGGYEVSDLPSVCWVPSMDALGSPWCSWDQPWDLMLLSPLPSLGFTAHHRGAWGGSVAGRCSPQWDVQERKQGGGEEWGGRGRERGWILLPFQASDCLVLLCLNPSLDCVGKKP